MLMPFRHDISTRHAALLLITMPLSFLPALFALAPFFMPLPLSYRLMPGAVFAIYAY